MHFFLFTCKDKIVHASGSFFYGISADMRTRMFLDQHSTYFLYKDSNRTSRPSV